ncbi:mechanosensitive ion channel domain-containing protein [Mesonia sediminis]|jgi:small-conductance mechanosensitive channel|uniref:Mechanosensitive ion channel domain-containing protein n=1 Tax=Mesonia sediminis TaxID=1703946 RepID=A0ABW5SEC9_9FLAO
MHNYFNTYQRELFITLGILIFLGILKYLFNKATHKIYQKEAIHQARFRLIIRYINVFIVFLAIFLLMVAWGVKIQEISLLFSSIFAVIGIALFAIWSILSNITSGIIMFFSFPYRIGDRIKIHDKDFIAEPAIIEDIKAFHLYLRLENGELITYPNNLILQKPVSLIQKDALLDKNNSDFVD